MWNSVLSVSNLRGEIWGVSVTLAAMCPRPNDEQVPREHVYDQEAPPVPESGFTRLQQEVLHFTGPFRCQSLIMLIFYIRVGHPRHEMNIGTLNLLRCKSNNPESKSGCFLKNLKYSSLICTCAPTEILFLFLDLFTVESKCWNLCPGPVSNTHYLYNLLIMLLWF